MHLVCATHPRNDAIARCVNCGLHLCTDCRMLDGVRNLCSRCSARMKSVAVIPAAVPRKPTPRCAWLASGLSLVPGLGQAYSGRFLRGALFFGSAMALREAWWLSPLLAAYLYVFNLFDAWRLAKNRTEGFARGQAPLRSDDSLFLFIGLGAIALTLLGRGGFFAAPHSILMPLSALAAGLVVAHETRR